MPWSDEQWRAMAASYTRKLGRKRARKKLHELKKHRLRDKKVPVR